MRLRHPSGRIVHLSCEIAPRPESNLPGLVDRLDTYGAVRARLGADRLGVNLWLPPALAAALAVESRARTRLRAELDARRLEVVTLSGAPFAEGGGDQPTTEPEPTWTEPARREYTLDLARILLDLLDADAVRGAVSTMGLGPRTGWAEASDKAGAGILRRLSAGLADLAWQNGRAVRVGFQPGAGFVLDTPEQTVAALSRIDKERLGVCLDLGHIARTWADPAAGIEAITDAGLSVIEVRLTAVPGGTTEPWRTALRQVFGAAGPLTEYLTLLSRTPDPTPEQVAADVAYLLAELAALGLAPEVEPCPVR
ncbi:TIM barrel protein [Actinoplanes sp. NPDC026619]|uniref:sugar phosphate isomerase/epimerase family protein n=1 Tax=Actinoplanes sp. NPDC026619 TaxID=3155798 RepID=UPI0033F95ABA